MTRRMPSKVRRWSCFAATAFGLLGSAQGDESPQTATFAMYCYWTGEATLGRVEGVVASRIGHWSGEEIVQIDFDPVRTNLAELVAALEERRSLYHVVVENRGEADAAGRQLGPATKVVVRAGRVHFIEPKHSLRTRHPDLWALDLNESQKIALNFWSYFGGPMPDVLSDEQKQRTGR